MPIYSGFIESNNIEDYLPNREKYLNKGRGSDYKNAIAKIDEFLADPLVNISFVLLIQYGEYFHIDSLHSDSASDFNYLLPFMCSYIRNSVHIQKRNRHTEKFGSKLRTSLKRRLKTPVQIQYETTCQPVKQELTNDDRLKSELLSVRAEYSETYLQLQNEKKVSVSLMSEKSALIDQNKIMCEKISSLEREKKELLTRLNCSNSTISSLENENKNLCKKVKAIERNNIALLDKSTAQIKQINVLEARTKTAPVRSSAEY